MRPALPSPPDRKLLPAASVGDIIRDMEFIRIVETWDANGFERVVYAPDGHVLDYSVGPSPYANRNPPFLKFNCAASPWERES